MNQNYTPLTEETRKLFSQLVDVNWEIKLQWAQECLPNNLNFKNHKNGKSNHKKT